MVYDLIVGFVANAALELLKAAGRAAFKRFDEKELKDIVRDLLQWLNS